MSPTKTTSDPQIPSARARVAAERAREEQAAKRKRGLVVTVAAVAVLVVAVGFGIAVQSSKSDEVNGPVRAPVGAVGADFAIPFGSPAAPVTLGVYEDFRCPFCMMTERAIGPVYKQYAAAGQVKLEYHIVDLIDRNLGGEGSLVAGNAGACAQDAGKFEQFHDMLYANQPGEDDDAFASKAAMIGFARRIPGLDSPAFDACVRGGTHESWVKADFAAFSAKFTGEAGTPTLLINGTKFAPETRVDTQATQYVQEFRKALDALLPPIK